MRFNIKQHTILITTLWLLVGYSINLKATETVILHTNELIDVSPSVLLFSDESGRLTFEEVMVREFRSSEQSVSNLGVSDAVHWVKIQLINKAPREDFVLELAIPTLDEVVLFSDEGDVIATMGESFSFHERKYKAPNFYFDLSLPNNTSSTYYLMVKNTDIVQLPMQVGTVELMQSRINQNTLFFGLYVGLMFLAILYNLFVYFSVRDKSYILYVIYILLVLFTQTALQGFTFQYVWPNAPQIAMMSNFFLPVLVGIAGMEFMKIFLKVKEYSRIFWLISFPLSVSYILALVLTFFDLHAVSLKIIELTAIAVSFYMLTTSIVILKKGYQPAKYFMAAWVVFLLGVIAYVLKDVGVLPYNNFTRYTMQIGSAAETILLSFALAARINIYKKERLEAVQEKEQLLREQNIVLEQKVEERTKELNLAMKKLKDAQVQLVDSEKMSSLGQLTAGIAHEINNPINFVSSNIPPLRQDLEDIQTIMDKYGELSDGNVSEKLQDIEKLKQELDYEYLKTELVEIVNGIEDGAKRTTEIVSGLRNFSRLDEGEFKEVDINEGIRSSLILIKNKIGDIQLAVDLCESAVCEVSPSKINQVIINLLDNAIFAINERFENAKEGKLIIETRNESDHIYLRFSDNGSGIPADIRAKVFDPFFTTKEVGMGTGLGLSIVRGILDKHQSTYELLSKENEGTTFTIKLPKTLSNGEN